MRIICFGDSNTYGYDPRSWFGDRYPASCRWPEIIAAATGNTVFNLGMNGRTFPRTENEINITLSIMSKYAPVDILIIMLGSNDILCGRTEPQITMYADCFLKRIKEMFPQTDVFLLSPSDAGNTFLPDTLSDVAAVNKCFFEDTSLWNLPLAFDNLHLTEEANIILSEKIINTIEKLHSKEK